MIFKRQVTLLKELIYSRKYNSVQHYAELFQVSTRTIHFDLDVLEDIVKEYHCRIVKKPGKGIFLDGKENDKNKLLHSLQNYSRFSNLSPAERQIQILEKLVNEERLSYKLLSQKYFVSRTSIAKDFKVIKEMCSKEGVLLEYDNDGTFLVGHEKNLQSLLKKLYLRKFEQNYYRFPNNLIEYKQFLLDTDNSLPHSFIEETFNIVCTIGEKYNLADHYLISLQNTLIVLCLRVYRNKHHEQGNGYVFEKVQQLGTYFVANEIAEEIEKKLNISLTEEDIVYINECLIANGIENLNITSNHGYYSKLVQDLIKKFSKIINTNLTKDKKLYKGLLTHIVPMIYRLNNNIRLQNPLIKEIKKQYSVMFNITWFVLVDLEAKLNIHIPEDEIGFIMVHFQSALERHEDIKKVLIVCPIGIVTSELLETRIKKYLPSLNLYEVVSVQNLNPANFKKFDYIISTVPLEVKNFDSNRIFFISPIPTDKELKELTNLMTDKIFNAQAFYTVNEYNREVKINNFLLPNSIFVNNHFNSMHEILEYLISYLEHEDLVTPLYRKSVFDREATSSTALETGVAIPHGNPDYVKKTSISILVNNKKVHWGNEKVDIIILLSVAKNDVNHISSIISQIYDVISDRNRMETVFFGKSKENIYDYFYDHY